MQTNKAFDTSKYLTIQKEAILERINQFGGKLYLEFGGKLFDDLHASRVLPGFESDAKLKLLLSLKDMSEIIMVINSEDIKNYKTREDFGITYDAEVERLINAYLAAGLRVNGVVFSFYEPNPVVDSFIRKLKNLNIKSYKHYRINGYPQNLSLIVSENGLGKNEYIPTKSPLVVVTAPGPGSGKMAVCLSQLYHDNKKGIKSGYAKYETFPVWNLPINHPVNVAYEAATLDLFDVNMIDPYHLESYNILSVNYNRDVEAFPLLKRILDSISESPYKSPTDMGVNKVKDGFIDEEIIKKAAKDEVIRRYITAKKEYFLGKATEETIEKAENLMQRLELSLDDRKCIKTANEEAERTGRPTLAIQVKDGTIITGKRSEMFTPTSAALLNVLKYFANIDDSLTLISKNVFEPIQELKQKALHNINPKIHAEEILIALAIQASTNPLAELAYSKIGELEGCEAHSSCLMSKADLKTLNKLGVRVTEEAKTFMYAKKD